MKCACPKVTAYCKRGYCRPIEICCTNEEWRSVFKPYNNYEISSCGRLRRTRWQGSKKLLKGHTTPDGYRSTWLSGAEDQMWFIHRIVAKVFVDNSRNKPCVNHLNGEKQDNHATNLEWCTPAENTRHAMESGLKHDSHMRGTNNHAAKLSESQVLEIKYRKGTISSVKLAIDYPVSSSVIRNIWAGKIWKHLNGIEISNG